MTYLLEPKYRKYVCRYSFLTFPKKIVSKYGKKFADTATKTGIDSAKRLMINVVKK